MAGEDVKSEADEASTGNPPEKSAEKKREIKGGLPYSTAPGTFKKILDAMIVAERPDRFSADFMATILKVSGGSARQAPPLLKKMGFLSSEGAPTDLYSKFKSDSARGQAALDGLKSAYSEMFRRNQFVYRADEGQVKDLIVEITGLKKSDSIVRMIYQSFDAIRSYADNSLSPSTDSPRQPSTPETPAPHATSDATQGGRKGNLGLSYHINVVLPETENIAVFNAIFRSLRENLL